MTRMQHDRFATINGLRLHYRETGRATGPTAVVLHGIMGHGREWDTLTTALGASHRVITLDQRGHGRSEWSDHYTAAAMADDLLGLADHLAVGRVLLVGHSMGGMAALLAAAREPGLAERLVLLDIGPDSITPELAAGLVEWLDFLARSSYDDVDEAVDTWLAGDPLARPELMRNYVHHALRRRDDGRLVWRFDAANLGGFVTDGVTAAELADAARVVAVPTLVVRGVHSPILSSDAARRLVTELADGRLVEIPDAAHDLGVQQPEAVAHAISGFVAAR